MTDKDLKETLETYRKQIQAKDKKIKDIKKQLIVYQKEAGDLRIKRDQLNAQVKEMSTQAKVFRESRDQLNAKAAELRKKRKDLLDEIKNLGGNIKESKTKRDELNKKAKGSDDQLERLFERNLNTLVLKDIPLTKEIQLYEQVCEVMGRMGSAKEASQLHKAVVSSFQNIQGLNGKLDAISKELHEVADEANLNHQSALDLYTKADAVRKEADGIHKQLIERYEVMNPYREQINALLGEIDVIRQEMAPFQDESDKLRTDRENERKMMTAQEVKEKLAQKKRVSLDDFRILLEQEGMPLGDEKQEKDAESKKSESPAEEKSE
ncbi:Chromosome partition protein Smc [uncultured archaeon]|nr:Chromosome partition protein Smc [uncultured archaeon]